MIVRLDGVHAANACSTALRREVEVAMGRAVVTAVPSIADVGGTGVPVRAVQCTCFAIGAALAGLGGVLGAELMPLEPYYALKYLVLVLVFPERF